MSKTTHQPDMPKEQREWLKKLVSKGVIIELLDCNGKVIDLGENEDLDFSCELEFYRIPSQPIPDISDWRELCREMQEKGVRFEFNQGFAGWDLRNCIFSCFRNEYRIPQQSLPECMEEMTEEIPHLELQIQWHKDKIHSLETGEPMREWEFRFNVGKEKSGWLKFGPSEIPAWDDGEEYRRKPRTVTYWTFVMQSDGEPPEVIIGYTLDEAKHLMRHHKELYPSAKFSPITETTVELED